MTETTEVNPQTHEPDTLVEKRAELASPTLWIHGLPDDEDDGELEMRLARFGELLKLGREGERAIANFRHIRAASDAKEKLNGYKFGSGNTISIEYAPPVRADGSLAEIDAITGQVIRSNREMHWKIGQLVRSTYSAMRTVSGNYPPPKQNLVPGDIKYLTSLDENLELESKWAMDQSVEEKMRDYLEFEDRRPFHNRYVMLEVHVSAASGLSPKESIVAFVQNLIGITNLLHVEQISPDGDETKKYFHLALKSTRDASIIFSAINASLSSGEGGLMGSGVNVSSIKYAPPLSVTSNVGALWLGCSAFIAVDENQLRSMLGLFGDLVSFKIVPNKNCAFVTFSTQEACIACRNKLFSYELAPGHFLNTDFAPEYEEGGILGHKRRGVSHGEFEAPKRHSSGDVRVELSKMGERMCAVLARKIIVQTCPGDDQSRDFFLPKEMDITSRTKIDYCKTHLEKLGCVLSTGEAVRSSVGSVIMWQFAAASERDCAGYDALCDYFVNKDRIGFFPSKDQSVVTYFIPPVPQFLEPLGLAPDTRYLIALQMPAASAANQ